MYQRLRRRRDRQFSRETEGERMSEQCTSQSESKNKNALADNPVKENIREKQIYFERSKALFAGLNKCWQEGLYTDVRIIVGSKSFSAHKVVLASLSDYFKPLFELDSQPSGEITLHILSAEDFSVLLNYAYTGHLDINKDNAQSLLVAADYLSVTSVKTECELFMTGKVDVENVCDTLRFASSYSLSTLLPRALDFFKQHTSEASKTSGFLLLDPTFLADIMSDHNLILSVEGIPLKAVEREKLILKVVLRYLDGCAQLESCHAEAVMSSVRLSTIPKDDIKKAMKDFKTLKKTDLVKKFLHLREVALKYLRQRNKDHSLTETLAGKEAEEIPDAWFHQRKLGQWKIVQPRQGYAIGNHVGIVRGPPSYICESPEVEIERIEAWVRLWDGRRVLGGFRLTYRNPNSIAEEEWAEGGDDGQDDAATASASSDSFTERSTPLQYSQGRCLCDDAADYCSATLKPGEYIVKVTIGCGFLIDRLKFKTNRGKTIGPFGGPGGAEHSELAPSQTSSLAYLYDINCESVVSQGSPALFNLRFRWITFE